jgi:rubrerythrin
MGCPTHMAGAEVSVANIANGVTVTITTKDASKVKELQEKAAKHFAKRDKAGAGKAETWVCPMGCASSDKPGKCPKCKMDLKKK